MNDLELDGMYDRMSACTLRYFGPRWHGDRVGRGAVAPKKRNREYMRNLGELEAVMLSRRQRFLKKWKAFEEEVGREGGDLDFAGIRPRVVRMQMRAEETRKVGDVLRRERLHEMIDI